MDDTSSTSFELLFGRQQDLASTCIDCLLALDLTELRVREPLVAKAGDKNPFQCSRPAFEFFESLFIGFVTLLFAVNYNIPQAAIPHIRATDDGVGAIGNMSSVHGHYATKDKPAYIIAKHGLTGLTRAIAAEGEGTLRGFSVSAGYVLTPLMVDQIEDTASERGISKREVIENVMLGQARTKEMRTPAEVANLFVFGFSSHAKHLNGGDLLFDGGYTVTYE